MICDSRNSATATVLYERSRKVLLTDASLRVPSQSRLRKMIDRTSEMMDMPPAMKMML